MKNPNDVNQYQDFDGRPSVDRLADDPLLLRLMAVHGEPRFDIFPRLKDCNRGVKDHA